MDRQNKYHQVFYHIQIFVFSPNASTRRSQKDLQDWQRTLNNFIWNYKRHRISYKIMRNSQVKGHLGIPDLAFYYEAANLVDCVRILNTDIDIDWIDIELWSSKNLSRHEIFWSCKSKRPP